MKKTTSNPTLYHDLLRPFESKGELDKASRQFLEELGTLREKYRLPDVVVLAQAEAMVGGKPAEFYVSIHFGNGANKIPMLAQALGRARGDLDAHVARLRRPLIDP